MLELSCWNLKCIVVEDKMKNKFVIALALMFLLAQVSVFATESDDNIIPEAPDTCSVSDDPNDTSSDDTTTSDTSDPSGSDTTPDTSDIYTEPDDISVTTDDSQSTTDTTATTTDTYPTTPSSSYTPWYSTTDTSYETTNTETDTTIASNSKTKNSQEIVAETTVNVTGVQLAQAKLSKKDITLYGITSTGENYSWVIKHDTITNTASDVDLTIKTSNSPNARRISTVVPQGINHMVLSLSYSGKLPFEATFAIDVNKNLFPDNTSAYLYSYNRGTSKGDYVKNVEIRDGIAAFSISKGADYFIANESIEEKIVPTRLGGLKTQLVFIFCIMIISLLIGTIIYRTRLIIGKIRGTHDEEFYDDEDDLLEENEFDEDLEYDEDSDYEEITPPEGLNESLIFDYSSQNEDDYKEQDVEDLLTENDDTNYYFGNDNNYYSYGNTGDMEDLIIGEEDEKDINLIEEIDEDFFTDDDDE